MAPEKTENSKRNRKKNSLFENPVNSMKIM
jgi:hypothetical protein